MMRKLFAILLIATTLASSATAQSMTGYIDASTRKLTAVTTDRPLPVIGLQESVQLASANTPAAPTTVAGGDYILSQTCTAYGTLALQALGPDGATWQTLLSKTASDIAGGSGLALGSYAKVRITVTGTSGCYAILARVPS